MPEFRMIYEWTDGIPVSLQPKYSETAMTIDLYINEANDYARDIGAPVLHPHVCVIHYDEVGEIRHTLNRTNCYAYSFASRKSGPQISNINCHKDTTLRKARLCNKLPKTFLTLFCLII